MLSQAIQEGDFPVPGKLWAIACEGMTLDELKSRAQEVSQHCTVVVDWPNIGADGNFLDCLCLLFVAKDEHNQSGHDFARNGR